MAPEICSESPGGGVAFEALKNQTAMRPPVPRSPGATTHPNRNSCLPTVSDLERDPTLARATGPEGCDDGWMHADIVIRGGTVLDGTGAPGQPGDVAITGGRISEIGANLQGSRV